MTTEQHTDLGADQSDSSPKGLRDALERAKEREAAKDQEIQVLKAQQMQLVVEHLGLDITHGPGKAVADFYKGEPEAEKVAEFATEYGWVRPKPKDEGPAPAIREAQQRITEAVSGGQPVVTNASSDLATQVREAEARGDWVTALRIKTGLIVEELTNQ